MVLLIRVEDISFIQNMNKLESIKHCIQEMISRTNICYTITVYQFAKIENGVLLIEQER